MNKIFKYASVSAYILCFLLFLGCSSVNSTQNSNLSSSLNENSSAGNSANESGNTNSSGLASSNGITSRNSALSSFSSFVTSSNKNITSSGKMSSSSGKTASGSRISSQTSQPTSSDNTISSASNTIVFNIKLNSNAGKIINNIFSHCGMWYGNNKRGSQFAGQAANALINKFPFVQSDTLHAMTGGGSNVDLYIDKNDPSKGMSFTDFNKELLCVLNQGIIPYIKIGSVPECLSNDASNGGMGLNIRPPTTTAQWNQYYAYVKAIAQDVVDTFGLAKARTWQWGCFSEANNNEWFQTSDKNAVNTKNAYFKLYDFTVAALQSVLGADKFTMGTHLLGDLLPEYFSCVEWDELDFIDHCASGKNYYTGGTRTQLNFIAISHYESNPGNSVHIRSFTESASRLLKRASADGLSIKIGVDEYGIIADQNNIQLCGSRTIGLSWQTSKTASDFKEMVDAGYSYASIWVLTSSQDVDGARTNQANVAALAYKMAGSAVQTENKTGNTLNSSDNVDAIASYNNNTHTTYVFVFNHNENLKATVSEKVAININNIAAVSGSPITVNKYILDSTHSNWFNTWWNDKGSSISVAFSQYDINYPRFLLNKSDITYWNNNVDRYSDISEIHSETVGNFTMSDNNIKIETTLAHHSVVLFEIKNSKIS